MNTLICAGGSGAKVLESLLHLCAAGLGPPSLRVLMIDPDDSNGNGERTRKVLEAYLECRRRVGENLPPPLGLFGTALDLLGPEGGRGGLKAWSPVRPRQKLAEIIDYHNLPTTSTPQDVAHLFFTKDELFEMEFSQGFRGHAPVGAAAMSLVAQHADRRPWSQLVEKIRNDLSSGQSRVFVTGSVFGGTGASAIHPVVRYLRSAFDSGNGSDRLRIGVAALVPYFRFETSNAKEGQRFDRNAAKSELFPLATKAAVEFYEHLRINGQLPFDVMHWVGDSSPISVDYDPGGPGQWNRPHFVELLAGLRALDFFRNPNEPTGSTYACPRQNAAPELGEQNVLEWGDLPCVHVTVGNLRDAILRFFLVGMAHVGFFGPLLSDGIERNTASVPWYRDRFVKVGDLLTESTNRESLNWLTEYYEAHHFPWWLALHRTGDSAIVRLMNPAAIMAVGNSGSRPQEIGRAGVYLNRMANALWPDRPGDADPDRFDDFFTETVRVPKRAGGPRGAAAYISLLWAAADAFANKQYASAGQLAQEGARA